MNDTTKHPPLGVRLLYSLIKQPDLQALSPEELAEHSAAQNHKVESPLMRLVTGFPNRATQIEWHQLALADREQRVRVYRGSTATRPPDGLPLVIHVHGGGFVGTAAQCDWINSHLAAQLSAVVVSVEHRLLGPETPLSAAVDDCWDTLQHVLGDASRWGISASNVAIVGESAGGTIAALCTLRARQWGLPLRAQVLVNPCTDVTASAFDYPSMAEHSNTPTLNLDRLELMCRLAVPTGTGPRAVSPLYADDLSELPPALVAIPTLDPLADQGRRYAEKMGEAQTSVQVAEYRRAGHAFVSMPGLVPQAKAARRDITAFLRKRLSE